MQTSQHSRLALLFAIALLLLAACPAAAHGEAVVATFFWWAFALVQGATLAIVSIITARHSGRFRLPGLVVVSATCVAVFAALSPESGAVWPCLFLPALLTLSLGLVLRSRPALKSPVVHDACVAIVVAYCVLLAVYLFFAVRGTVLTLRPPGATSYPWQAAWAFAVLPAISYLPHVVVTATVIVGLRHAIRQARTRVA